MDKCEVCGHPEHPNSVCEVVVDSDGERCFCDAGVDYNEIDEEIMEWRSVCPHGFRETIPGLIVGVRAPEYAAR